MSKRGHNENSYKTLPDGRVRWRATVTYKDGRKSRATGTSKNLTAARRDAETAKSQAAQIESPRQQIANTLEIPKALKVAQQVELFIGHMAYTEDPQLQDQKWSRRTTEHNRALLNRHILPLIGDYEAAGLTPDHLDGFYASLTARGLGNSGQKQIAALLSGAYKWAVKKKFVKPEQNPTVHSRPVKTKRPPNKDRILSFDVKQAEKFLAACEHEPLGLPVAFLLWTGLRIGELTALRRSDVVIEEDGTVAVSITKSRTELGSQIYEGKTKTDKSTRTIYLQPEAVDILERRQQRSATEAAYLGQPETEYLFASIRKARGVSDAPRQQMPLLHNTVRQAMERICDAAGLPRLSPHKLRHTCASLLVAQGHPLPAISEHLGHAKISTTTDFYVHSNAAEKKKLRIQFDKNQAAKKSESEEQSEE